MRLVILILMIFSHGLFGQDKKKIKVAVLGTFHFGKNMDYVSSDFDDLLNPVRQKEIDDVINKLAKFNPSKVFVENTPDVQNYWNKVYLDWKKGILPNKETENSEVFQLGIKLSARLNNPIGVICVNYVYPEYGRRSLPSKNRIDSLYSAYSYNLSRLRPNLTNYFKLNPIAQFEFESFYNEFNSNKNNKSIKNLLLEVNKVENLKKLHYFNVLGFLDNDINGIGAELTAREYQRNTMILKNIYLNFKPTDERVLIIIGAGHAEILKSMINSHPLLELVEIKSILK